MQKIILLGSGGHAKSVVDTIVKLQSWELVGFLDKNLNTKYRNYEVIGNDSDLQQLFKTGIKNAFISIGFLGKSNLRNNLYQYVKNLNFGLPVIIDPSAIVADDVTVGEGVYIGKKAVINSDSNIEKMCIINTNAVIEHECKIGEFTHISVSATICGGVVIGKNTFVGANATVVQGVTIGDNVIVGAGTTVLKNIKDNEVYYGLNKYK